MFSQQDRDPSWKKYVGIAQPCPRSSSALDSSQTLSRAGPTYAEHTQNAFGTGLGDLEYRRQQYLQQQQLYQQQQQKHLQHQQRLQQQEVPHYRQDYPPHQGTWQQQSGEEEVRREAAEMARYRQFQHRPEESYLYQRVPLTSVMMRENLDEGIGAIVMYHILYQFTQTQACFS